MLQTNVRKVFEEMQALQGGMREKVELATKFGLSFADGKREIKGDPAYVRAACEASLNRLGIDCIDLYYQHRIDTRVPIEVTVSWFCRFNLLSLWLLLLKFKGLFEEEMPDSQNKYRFNGMLDRGEQNTRLKTVNLVIYNWDETSSSVETGQQSPNLWGF